MGDDVSKFKLLATVVRRAGSHTRTTRFEVELEANGFKGHGESSIISAAFGDAYDELTANLLAGTNPE